MAANERDQASNLHDSIASARDVLRMIRQNEREDQFLEFKTTQLPMNDYDKRSLSKSLSGFANSGGGVVVWGVRTRKGERGDVAYASQANLDAMTLVDEIDRRLANSVQPLVPGVLVEALPRRPRGRKGFVKMLIPPSDARPHRALLAEDRHYYQRSGSEFHIISHAVLRDMFTAARAPALTCHVANLSEGGQPRVRRRGRTSQFSAELAVVLRNDGRGIARYPSVEMLLHESLERPIENRLVAAGGGSPQSPLWAMIRTWRRDHPCDLWRWDGGASCVVHAGCTLTIAIWQLQVAPHTTPGAYYLHCRLMAENMEPRETDVAVTIE